jgi:transposase
MEAQHSRKRRRRYSRELKTQILAECDAPGASVAQVAMLHGINANIVHGWRKLARHPEPALVRQRVCAREGSHCAGEHRRARHRARTSPRRGHDQAAVADGRSGGTGGLHARAAAMIRVEAVWMAVEPLDLRAGTEAALAKVVAVFGAARPHHAYLFTNRRANRMKVLVHDGIGVWLAARRLNSGKFAWPKDITGTLTLTREQFDALVLGLPWQRLGGAAIITVL